MNWYHKLLCQKEPKIFEKVFFGKSLTQRFRCDHHETVLAFWQKSIYFSLFFLVQIKFRNDAAAFLPSSHFFSFLFFLLSCLYWIRFWGSKGKRKKKRKTLFDYRQHKPNFYHETDYEGKIIVYSILDYMLPFFFSAKICLLFLGILFCVDLLLIRDVAYTHVCYSCTV